MFDKTKAKERPPIRTAADAALYEEWVHAFEKDCYRFAYRLVGDPQLALDCVQETFLRVWKYGRFDRIDNVKAWLFTTLRNIVLNDARKRRPETVGFGDWDPSVSFDEEALARRVAVSDAIKLLPPNLLELIVLRYWAGFTDEAISTIVGIPLGTVKSSLSRARAILRKDGGLDPDPKCTPKQTPQPSLTMQPVEP